MADLNLIPDPKVLVVNTGIFLANLICVKKLFVEPYLELKSKRGANTTGNQEQSNRFLNQNEELEKQIDTTLNKAYEDSTELRKKLTLEAVSRREESLRNARLEADKLLEGVRESVSKALEAEKAKLPTVIEALSKEVYEKSIG